MLNKGISEIIIVIIIGAVLAAGMFLFFRMKFPPTEMPEVTEKQEESVEEEYEVTDWKDYRSEEYGFELKYPKDWYAEGYYVNDKKTGDIISSIQKETGVVPKDLYADLIISYRSETDLEQKLTHISKLIERSKTSEELTVTEFMVGDIKVYKEKNRWILTWTLIRPDNKGFYYISGSVVNFRDDEERFTYYEKILDDIVSSFKITEEEMTTSSADTQQWKEFSSVAEGFKMLFPTYPTRAKEEVKLPTTNSPAQNIYYTSITSDKIIYSVNLVIYPQEVDMKGFSLEENVLNNMIEEFPAELISSNFTTLHGYQTLDFLIQHSVPKVYIKGRTLLVDHTLYVLMMDYRNENYNESDYNRFINSFQLIK